MLRTALRPWFAGLLLLCLGRTLLPGAWALAWHPHRHTCDEPAWAARRPGEAPRLLFSARHQHCHAEQFYEVPFAATEAVALPQPRRHGHYPRLAGAVAVRAGLAAVTRRAAPRGPPLAPGRALPTHPTV